MSHRRHALRSRIQDPLTICSLAQASPGVVGFGKFVCSTLAFVTPGYEVVLAESGRAGIYLFAERLPTVVITV